MRTAVFRPSGFVLVLLFAAACWLPALPVYAKCESKCMIVCESAEDDPTESISVRRRQLSVDAEIMELDRVRRELLVDLDTIFDRINEMRDFFEDAVADMTSGLNSAAAAIDQGLNKTVTEITKSGTNIMNFANGVGDDIMSFLGSMLSKLLTAIITVGVLLVVSTCLCCTRCCWLGERLKDCSCRNCCRRGDGGDEPLLKPLARNKRTEG